jgi:3-isopropylmalate/(R)-2-methylmalate dehydratase small subunit
MFEKWQVDLEKFDILKGVAAPMLLPNINTDVIIRIERLVELPRDELGPYCFEAWRYNADGSDNAEFVLNKPSLRRAKILLAGPNFGCGSSREAAVWALWGMGFRCVIAPSFGEIFFTNCFQNGMLPIVLPELVISQLAGQMGLEAPAELTVDLNRQSISAADGQAVNFQIDDLKKAALLDGLDEITMTFRRSAEIDDYQARQRHAKPWLYEMHNSKF